MCKSKSTSAWYDLTWSSPTTSIIATPYHETNYGCKKNLTKANKGDTMQNTLSISISNVKNGFNVLIGGYRDGKCGGEYYADQYVFNDVDAMNTFIKAEYAKVNQ